MTAAASPPPSTAAICADCGKLLPPGHKGAVCHSCLWADPDESELPEIKPGGIALRIPGHDVETEIARGGMGIIYRAWEREAERRVALKMLLPHLADEQGMRERFRLEARAVAALDHPSVLPVYHIGVADDVPYFTMKLADGGSLLERRDRYAGKWRDIAALVASLAEAVHFAHTHGVLHRDLKPGNILFDDKDRPYLSDFGLVKIMDSESQLTRSRHFLGTPHYAAPEVAASSASEATVSSDVWSLGAVLYELLAGKLPFEAPGIPALLRKIVDESPPALPPEVPRDLSVICLKCLQKLPRQRFANAGELAGDLRRWLEGRSISARPMSRTERAWAWSRRNPALASLAAGLFAALVLTAAALWRENSANVRALEESRNAAIISRRAENAAQDAQAASRLDEARAIRRSGRLLDHGAAIAAVQHSRQLRPSVAARDELTVLLTMPHLKTVGTLPYTRRWSPAVDDRMTRYVTLEGDEDAVRGVSVRETGTGKVIWSPFANPMAGFRPGPLSPDGRFLVAREAARTSLWQEGNSKPVAVLPVLRAEPKFAADGSFCAFGGFDQPLHLADLRNSPPVVRIIMPQEVAWYPAAFSPDHKYLVARQVSGFALRVVDTATGAVMTECAPGHQKERDPYTVQSVCWSRRGDYFVAGMLGGGIARWSLHAALPEWIIPAHTGSVDSVLIAADDRLLISQSRDGQVRFTDLLTLETLGAAPWPGMTLDISTDRTLLAIDRIEHQRVDIISCQAPASSECGPMPPSRDTNPFAAVRRNTRVIAWPDGSKFSVTSGMDASTFDAGSVRRPLYTAWLGRLNDFVLDFESGRWLRRKEDQLHIYPPMALLVEDPVPEYLTRVGEASMAYDPVSRRVLVGFRQGFNLYDFTEKGEKETLPLRGNVDKWHLLSDVSMAVSAVTWSADGQWVAWAGTDKRELDRQTKAPPPNQNLPVLHVFDTEKNGAERGVIILPAAPHIVAFVTGSEPEPTAVLTADAATIACYDLTTRRERWRRPHQRTARDPAMLATARAAPVIAATFNLHTVSLLDPATGEPDMTLTQSGERTIQALDITPDGTRLLALAGNLVQLWRLDVLRRELEEELHNAPK